MTTINLDSKGINLLPAAGIAWVAGFNGADSALISTSGAKGEGVFAAAKKQEFFAIGSGHNQIESITLNNGGGA